MYLSQSVTTQIPKELHIICPLSKGIPNQCICSWHLILRAKMLCGDTENVLLLFLFDLFPLFIFEFLLFASLGARTNPPSPFYLLFAVWQFFSWNVSYAYFMSNVRSRKTFPLSFYLLLEEKTVKLFTNMLWNHK